MLSASFSFTSSAEVRSQKHKIEELVPSLIIVYASPLFFENDDWFLELREISPNIVGCSTAGEISSDQVHADSIVILTIKLEYGSDIAIHTSTLANMQASFDTGMALSQKINPQGLKGVYTLAPGLAVNGSAVINGLTSLLPSHVKLSGGLAGDNASFGKTFVISPEGISENTVVAVCFYGENLTFGYGAYGGWRSFGPSRSVTKANENLLFQLDDVPALTIYKDYLGDYASDLPANGLLFPLEVVGKDQKGTGLIRTILGIDEDTNSLTLAGDVVESEYVRLMHASTDDLIDGAQLAVANALSNPKSTHSSPRVNKAHHSLALVTSCVGRKLVMGDRVEEELECIKEQLPQNTNIAGFYSYGEICPFDNKSQSKLYNQTLSMTLIQEIAP